MPLTTPEPATATDTTAHQLEIISVGLYPAAVCTCKKWGFAFTRTPGDTMKTVKARIEEAHQEHKDTRP